jgi:hypothetical protein
MPHSARALMYVSRAATPNSVQVIARTVIVSSNDEVERRAVAPTSIEADLFQSSTPSLAQRRCNPRDRSNRLLDSPHINSSL